MTSVYEEYQGAIVTEIFCDDALSLLHLARLVRWLYFEVYDFYHDANSKKMTNVDEVFHVWNVTVVCGADDGGPTRLAL
jgi:hypothetical protein